MAVSSITVPPDAKRDAKARELLATAHLWPIETLKIPHGAFKVGDSFLVTPNGYRVNTVACECDDYRRFENICKHIRCAILLDAKNVSKPRKTIEDLMPTCQQKGCQNDPAPRNRYCETHWLSEAY